MGLRFPVPTQYSILYFSHYGCLACNSVEKRVYYRGDPSEVVSASATGCYLVSCSRPRGKDWFLAGTSRVVSGSGLLGSTS